MIYILLGIYVAVLLVAMVVLAIYSGGEGSWVKEDGTIIEWDKDGGRILRPNGILEEYKNENINRI